MSGLLLLGGLVYYCLVVAAGRQSVRCCLVIQCIVPLNEAAALKDETAAHIACPAASKQSKATLGRYHKWKSCKLHAFNGCSLLSYSCHVDMQHSSGTTLIIVTLIRVPML